MVHSTRLKHDVSRILDSRQTHCGPFLLVAVDNIAVKKVANL